MIYLILHGSFAKPEDNWFTWLKLKLEDAKNKVYLPAMPVDNYQTLQKDATSTTQNLGSWLDTLKPIVDEIISASQPASQPASNYCGAFHKPVASFKLIRC